MSDPMKQAWNDVAEGFSTLGRMMKERYEAASADEASDTAAAASAANRPRRIPRSVRQAHHRGPRVR